MVCHLLNPESIPSATKASRISLLLLDWQSFVPVGLRRGGRVVPESFHTDLNQAAIVPTSSAACACELCAGANSSFPTSNPTNVSIPRPLMCSSSIRIGAKSIGPATSPHHSLGCQGFGACCVQFLPFSSVKSNRIRMPALLSSFSK